MTAGNGSMIRASDTANICSRPGHLMTENAYAARTQDTSVPATVQAATMVLFAR